MRWIMAIRHGVILDGKKRRKHYVTKYPSYAALSLVATGKVKEISEEEARRRAPNLFEDVIEAEVRKEAETLGSIEAPSLPEEPAEEDETEDLVAKLEAMTSKQLAAWLRDHEEEVSVPRTKAERFALALELVEGP